MDGSLVWSTPPRQSGTSMPFGGRPPHHCERREAIRFVASVSRNDRWQKTTGMTERSKPVKDDDNLMIERPTFVPHLECSMDGDHYPADQVHNLSKAGKPLLVRYDLAGVKKALSKEA